MSYRTPSLLILSSLATIALLSACGALKDAENKADAPGKPQPSPAPTSIGGTPTVPAFKATEYVPEVGDERVMSTKSKAWEGNEAEPSTWSDIGEETVAVVATYKPGLACKARVSRKSSTEPTLRQKDVGCGELEKPFKCDAAPACDEEKTVTLGKKDIGPWKGSVGTKTTCRQVAENPFSPGTYDLVHSETTLWQSNEILDGDRVVLMEYFSCTISELTARSEGAKEKIPDVCKAKGRVVKFFKSEDALKSQKRGAGGKMLTVEDKASFKVTNDSRNPAGAIRHTVRCRWMPGIASGGKMLLQGLEVSILQQYCSPEKKLHQRMLSLAPIPKGGFETATKLDPGVLLSLSDYHASTPGNFALQASGDCKATATIDRANGAVIGSIECGPEALKHSSSSATASVTETTFSCLAPSEYLN